MSIVDDLNESIKESKNKIDNITKELDDFVSIKNNINSIDGSLHNTIKKIDDLVDAFKGTKDSFVRVAESLEESANILKRTDPAELIKNQNEQEKNIIIIKENIDNLSKQLNENIKTLNDDLKQSTKNLERKINNKKGIIFG